jgi:cytochrome bd-type quinol oxidase subunit 2
MVVTKTEPDKYLLCLLAFLVGGTFISICVSLWGEEQADKRRRWIAETASLALFAVYCVLLFLTDIIPNRGLPAFYFGNLAWMAAVVILIPFGSFLREKDDLKSWHFLLALIGSLVISGIVTWVMAGGLEGLVFGTAALFDFSPNERLTIVIMIVCSVLLFGLLFLALIPQAERKHNNSTDTPSFLTKSVSWLLIPLLGCYIVVLYVYGINILVHWELPKGMISWLVSAVMAGYLLCYILLYPQVTDKQSWQSKLLTRWLPVAVMPLLVLMTVGVIRRFMDYGLTAPRLYLLTLLLWFYAVCVVMLTVERKRFRWIFLSLAALFLLSSGHPMNYYRLCRPVLAAKIDKMMENKVLTEEESEQLDKELKYMKDCYGKDFVSRWGEIDTAVVVEPSITEWQIHYYQSNDYVCPQGYSHIKRINRVFRYSPDTSPDRDLRDGILPVRYENNIILLFDTAAIRQADLHSAPMIIPSADKKSAYVPITITISSRSDKTINFDYSGFLFTK